LSLAEIARKATLKEGHLTIGEHRVALAYFRAGYTPEDYPSLDSREGRKLIEASSAIKAPDLPMQLAGFKKIQQVLASLEVLREFVSLEAANRLLSYFVGLYPLDRNTRIDQKIHDEPHRYILKPQREGGGSNLYDEEMLKKLQEMEDSQRAAYIVMERINTPSHSSILVVDSNSEQTQCISEVGRFGICFSEGENILSNEDVGYLVRTKQEDENEGGVCAGYACLDSLIMIP